jgi:hypothetical protein
MSLRNCFVLTCDSASERAQFCKNILEKVGFSVNFVRCIPHTDKVISNKISMQHIYGLIANGTDANEWVYVFEDDINVLEDITLDEIIEYEKISNTFFYLGVCVYNIREILLNKQHQINGHKIAVAKGFIRGLHSIALSKHGAKELLLFSEQMTADRYMDVILEKFSIKYPANVVRFDLESYIKGHRGIFYQDRNRFPSSI